MNCVMKILKKVASHFQLKNQRISESIEYLYCYHPGVNLVTEQVKKSHRQRWQQNLTVQM